MNKKVTQSSHYRTYLIIFLCLILSICQMKYATSQVVDLERHTLIFLSDVHGKISKLQSFLIQCKKAGIQSLDAICFSGDYDDSYKSDTIKKITDVVSKKYSEAIRIYTVGNHDLRKFNEEDFSMYTQCPARNYAFVGNFYSIYTFGAATTEQEFVSEDIALLKSFLDSLSNEQKNRPIFIVSHYPIHAYRNRFTENVNKVIDLLNDYPTTIFLYGHNHSLNDPSYKTISRAGEKIRISKYKKEEINFTYAAVGSICDGANQDIYGLVVTVEKDGSASLQYRNLMGDVLETVTVGIVKNQ